MNYTVTILISYLLASQKTLIYQINVRSEHRSDSLTKISDDSTLILNFKIFCEANKQEIKIVTV